MNFKSRLGGLHRRFSEDGLSSIVLTSLPSLRYFMNYSGQSFERLACAVISPNTGKSALVIPKLDELKASDSIADSVHPWTDSEGYAGALFSALKEIGYSKGTLGCEDGLAFWQMNALKLSMQPKGFESITKVLSRLRVCKTQEEVQSLEQAGTILTKGYKAISEGLIKSGMSERSASYEVKKVLSEAGATTIDFCAIQSGTNTAIPHLETTGKRIEKGDPILVDISISNEAGYFADYTRTFVIGKPRPELLRVHEIVKRAQRAGIKAASTPQITAEGVDHATRSVIEGTGYGDYFTHRTGHGIGLEVHEHPYIVRGNRTKLKRGMAFTVEPGIYLAGKFGVRIEDNLITKDVGKPMDLPHFTRDLLEI